MGFRRYGTRSGVNGMDGLLKGKLPPVTELGNGSLGGCLKATGLSRLGALGCDPLEYLC